MTTDESPISAVSTSDVFRRSELCRGLAATEIARLYSIGQTTWFAAAAAVFRIGDPSDALFVVLAGRVQLYVETAEGRRAVDFLGVGDHFGDMGVLADEPRTTSAEALVDSILLRLPADAFNALLTELPGLAANLGRTLVWRLHQETLRRRRRRDLAVVGIIHGTPTTRVLTHWLANALAIRGERVVVLTNTAPDLRTSPSGAHAYRVETIDPQATSDVVEQVHRRIMFLQAEHDRVLLDWCADAGPRLDAVLANCEAVWWVADSSLAESTFARLREHVSRSPTWLPRLQLVWLLPRGEKFGPATPDDIRLVEPPLKVTSEPVTTHDIPDQQRCIARLVRRLRGARIGLALGGGGARGLAHLGVFRALVRAGIDFDAVAGTSSGALFGLSYVGGWSAEYAVQEYERALTPGGPWPWLPLGHRLFLLDKYRRRAWDAMLRPYFGRATYEQLLVPFYTVATDLVAGRSHVQDQGDVIRGVMESINIPWVAPLIWRDGMALVDGAVLNNLPVDVLARRGLDFVIGVDVVARLRQQFAGNAATTPEERRRPAHWKHVLQRIVELQARDLSAARAVTVDFLINPATAGFSFADFSRARELADVGEAAAEVALPQLWEKLADLER